MPSPRRVRAVIFDLDGTLLDSGADIAASGNRVREAFGRAPLPLDVVLGFVGHGLPLLLTRLLRHDGGEPSAAELDRARRVFDGHYAEHRLDRTRPFPGVREALAGLAPLPLMVATNKPRGHAVAMLGGLDLLSPFLRVVAGDDVAERKPAPEMLLLALDGLELRPAETAMVGDSLADLGAGRAVGALTVGCTFGLRPRDEIVAAGPDVLLDDFAELPAKLAPYLGPDSSAER